MKILFQRAFWLDLAGACVIAVVAASPILMSGVMDRGFEIAKQFVAQPLALLALGAVLLAGGCRWAGQQGVEIKAASIALAAFLALAGVSAALSDMPEVALFGGYYRREGLIAWCGYGAFFFAVLGWARSAGRIEGFLDVLVLTSVIPAAYALQQRLDLDFYTVIARELARPGATLGNPVFLAAYLGLLLPITVVRCWQARRRPPELMLWLTVIVLQACGLLLTQSRGPLLAVIIGTLMLACFAAAYARAHRLFLGAAAAFVTVLAVLIAMNTLSNARRWAQDIPVISRLAFTLDRDAGDATRHASTSAAARLGAWGAGTETFAAAPLYRELLGFGPESAYMHYFPHMPALVVRVDGYGASKTYDRLHADTLDIALNFGLLGWLAYCVFFGSVMYAAARALFGLSGRAPTWTFFAFMLLGGTLSSAAAVLAGFSSAVVPAFGLGVGAGWFLFLVGCAWRALKQGVSRPAGIQPRHWVLLAGLTSALLVFWVDAQVNIPVLTTRLISFGIAAVILVIAGGMIRTAEDGVDLEPESGDALWIWGLAFSMVAVCASVLPEVVLDTTMQAQQAEHWWLRALPMLVVLLIAALAYWVHSRRRKGSGGAAGSHIAAAAGLALLYAAGHFALMVEPGPELSLKNVLHISIVSASGPLFIFGMCLAFAVLASRGAVSATNALPLSRAARFLVLALAAAVLLAASLNWRATRADVASQTAVWAGARQPQLSEQLVNEAIRLMPYERYYQRQLIFDLLGRAVADIPQLGTTPDRYPVVERNLAVAELQARETLKLFPDDAWSVLALANVLQIRALRFLRPFAPVAGETAAQEANELFLLAHRIFPAQPLVLRNWAQLLFDQGNAPDAYRLLDLMEKLIPNEIEPYRERIIWARQINDFKVISETLARARGTLDQSLYSELLRVANAQQN